MEIEKRSDLTARKVKLKEEEVMLVIDRYLARIEMMIRKGGFKKLMIPLGKNNIELLSKIVKEKYSIELDFIPVTSAENLFAVSLKQNIKSSTKS